MTAPSSGTRTITLITGDRVTVRDAAGGPTTSIEPGPGRASIQFSTIRHRDHVTVLPADVAPLVARGQLDRALFDVTQLLADGFGDDARDDIPLVVTGDAPRASLAASGAASGLRVGATLATLHATSIRQPKSRPGAALASVAQLVNTKLWLDRPYRPVLDHSAAQIGAPAAWARGATGAGVTVAVLDSGIDASHPDLAGKVIARSFVDDGQGDGDNVGHATHVASIIAGTGAASGGAYRGIAPDAQLLSGRVCTAFDTYSYCPTSAVLAALEWAVVEQRAPIVNLSLGGSDTPGLDPLEAAVEQLTSQYGTLFVIAAGNLGELGDGTILSPGSAPSALTVGAVDRDERIAPFSSRGPTAEGRALKPEITAPGVDIVAARASGVPPIGAPVGDAYQQLSGTSMAAPHVAGAAALLRQLHPTWGAAQLKAALIASAQPNPDFRVLDEGAGRVDVDRATRTHVTVDQADLDFGLVAWPHDDDPVIARALHYTNDGDAPITLALTAQLAPIAGGSAPSQVTVSPTSLTLAPGATGEAIVTVDTRGDAPDTAYAGTVIASAGDTRATTLLAIRREVESYDLTLEAHDARGDATRGIVLVIERSLTGRLNAYDVDGSLTVHLPRADYAAYYLPQRPVFEVYPALALDRATTIDFDESIAQPIDVRVEDTPLDFSDAKAIVWDLSNQFLITFGDLGSPGQIYTAHLGPPRAPSELHAWLQVAGVPAGSGPIEPPVGDYPGVAEIYGFAHPEHGRFLAGWREDIPRAKLATVDSVAYGHAPSHYRKFIDTTLPGVEPGIRMLFLLHDYEPGVHRIEHLYGPGIRWIAESTQSEPWPNYPSVYFAVRQEWQPRDYAPGRSYVERYNEGPYGPSLGATEFEPAASRDGDTLTFSASMFSDRQIPARAERSATTHERTALFRNGEKLVEHIDEHEYFLPPQQVPAAPATYRFEADYERGPNLLDGSPLFALSTHVTASWTFVSQHTTKLEALSVPTVRFVPQLDGDGRAPRAMVLPVVLERQEGAATPRITAVEVEVSYDEGASWQRVPGARIGDRWFGVLVHPRKAAFASLRAHAIDALGQRNDIAIIRAYRLGG